MCASSRAIWRSSTRSISSPATFDVVVSNCVINLCVDKLAVLRGAYRLLKPGGEIYFADVYCDRRLPDEVRADPLLYGECLGGALYWNDFLPMAKEAGFLDPRLVTSRPITVENEAMRQKLGQAKFFSATYRLFKLDGLEPACEDYGQAVIYRGGVAEQEQAFALDEHHIDRARQGVSDLRQLLAHAGRDAVPARISISSATSRPITGSSPAARARERRCPSMRRTHAARRHRAAARRGAIETVCRSGASSLTRDTLDAGSSLVPTLAAVHDLDHGQHDGNLDQDPDNRRQGRA